MNVYVQALDNETKIVEFSQRPENNDLIQKIAESFGCERSKAMIFYNKKQVFESTELDFGKITEENPLFFVNSDLLSDKSLPSESVLFECLDNPLIEVVVDHPTRIVKTARKKKQIIRTNPFSMRNRESKYSPQLQRSGLENIFEDVSSEVRYENPELSEDNSDVEEEIDDLKTVYIPTVDLNFFSPFPVVSEQSRPRIKRKNIYVNNGSDLPIMEFSAVEKRVKKIRRNVIHEVANNENIPQPPTEENVVPETNTEAVPLEPIDVIEGEEKMSNSGDSDFYEEEEEEEDYDFENYSKDPSLKQCIEIRKKRIEAREYVQESSNMYHELLYGFRDADLTSNPEYMISFQKLMKLGYSPDVVINELNNHQYDYEKTRTELVRRLLY